MASEIKTFRSLLLVLSALVFDTTSPRAKGDCLKSGWLGRVMGVSPLRGSLAAALLACFPYRELGLDGSIPRQGSWRNQPATGWFWDGWDRWAPYLAVIYTGTVPVQVVLAHPPSALGLPGTCSGSDIRFSKSITANLLMDLSLQDD